MVSKQNPTTDSTTKDGGDASESADAGQLHPVSGFAPKATHESLDGSSPVITESGLAPAGRVLDVPHAPPPAPSVELLNDGKGAAERRTTTVRQGASRHGGRWLAMAVILVAVALGAVLGYALRSVDGLRDRFAHWAGEAMSNQDPAAQERSAGDRALPSAVASSAVASAGATVQEATEGAGQEVVPAMAQAPMGDGSGDMAAPAQAAATGKIAARSGAKRPATVLRVPGQGREAARSNAARETASTAAIDSQGLPSRPAVVAGFEAVRGRLSSCASGRQGVAEVQATIAGSGRVTHALIGGDFQGTPEGSCMARAVRAASFPPFARHHIRVEYPFAL